MHHDDVHYEDPHRPQRVSPPLRSKSAAPTLAGTTSVRRRSPSAVEGSVAGTTLVEQGYGDDDDAKSEKAPMLRSQSVPPQQAGGDVKTKTITVRIPLSLRRI